AQRPPEASLSRGFSSVPWLKPKTGVAPDRLRPWLLNSISLSLSRWGRRIAGLGSLNLVSRSAFSEKMLMSVKAPWEEMPHVRALEGARRGTGRLAAAGALGARAGPPQRSSGHFTGGVDRSSPPGKIHLFHPQQTHGPAGRDRVGPWAAFRRGEGLRCRT